MRQGLRSWWIQRLHVEPAAILFSRLFQPASTIDTSRAAKHLHRVRQNKSLDRAILLG